MSEYVKFTHEQLVRAQAVPIAPLLRQRGFSLSRSGKELAWKQSGHDLITIHGNKWYSHYHKCGGTTISFVQRYFGLPFQEAVQYLLNDTGILPVTESTSPTSSKELPAMKRPFLLPPASDNNRRIYDYLTGTRCLAPDIVHTFMQRGQLYESAESHGNHYIHNLVLVGTDSAGVPRQAHIKGILPGSQFRRNAEGSDPHYGFAYYGTSPNLFVFEAAIDLLSYLTLHPNQWQTDSYVALDGVAEHALFTAMDEHPHLRHVTLCLDHDPGGQLGTIRLQNLLLDRGILADTASPREEKDWNEQLRHKCGQSFTPASDYPLLSYLQREYQSLCSRNVSSFPADMDHYEDLFRSLEAWSWARDFSGMAREMRLIACLSSVQARSQLRQVGEDIDPRVLEIRLFRAIQWAASQHDPQSSLLDLRSDVDKLDRQMIDPNGQTEDEKRRLADAFLNLAGKSLALCAHYEMQHQQQMGEGVTPCPIQFC